MKIIINFCTTTKYCTQKGSFFFLFWYELYERFIKLFVLLQKSTLTEIEFKKENVSLLRYMIAYIYLWFTILNLNFKFNYLENLLSKVSINKIKHVIVSKL